MYQRLKNIALGLFPKQFLFKHEIFFRSLFAFNLKGKNHQCTICGNSMKNFIHIDVDLLCPFCGSLARTRRLNEILAIDDFLKGKVLHFSPSRSLYRQLKTNKSIAYFSTDFEDEFLADYKYDITDIPKDNEFFDTVICYHILEHIPEDKKAMAELYRVLKPNGTCLIQTPFKEGEIYENPTVTSPEERLKHFGQQDHVRIYSVDGLCERLQKANFSNVKRKTFPKDDYKGLLPETVIFARK